MKFRERRKLAPDSDTSNGPTDAPDDTAVALAEAAEAEAEQAEAHVAAARDRATHLRQQATATAPNNSDDTSAAEPDNQGSDASETSTAPARRRWVRRPTAKTVSVGAVIVIVGASFAASSYIAWHHRLVSQKRLVASEFTSAARQDVAALMSLDFNNIKDGMQRISDNSTGTFKQHFPVIAERLTQGLQRSQIVTTVTVNDAAVESMTDNSALVLVAATTQAKEADSPPEPRTWHIALNLVRDGGQPKMSNVEFIQ